MSVDRGLKSKPQWVTRWKLAQSMIVPEPANGFIELKMSSPPSIFISYSHADEEWLQEFKTHLKPYLRNYTNLNVWDDSQIVAGARWREEIAKALDAATIAVLLVSPSFLASDFIANDELPPLLKAARERGLIIFWIPIRNSAYQQTDIKDYQSAYSASQPIAAMRYIADRDTAWTNVCQKLEKAWQSAKRQDPVMSEAAKEQVSAKAPAPVLPQVPTFEFAVVTVNAEGREIERQKHHAEYRREHLGHGVFLDVVEIPAGEFLMGSLKREAESSDRERPQHWVTVPRLFMGKYAVTQIQWRMVAALPRVNRSLDAEPLGSDLKEFEGDNRPIVNVSWHDAVEFCDRLTRRTQRTYRLPTEAEWEYACRAGTSTPFHFGEMITPDLVNYDSNYPYGAAAPGEYRERTTEVGNFGVANRFSLYDMHGNVWEWCEDHWHETYEGAPIDGKAWLVKGAKPDHPRLLRGGSWSLDSWVCRSAFRSCSYPDYRNYAFGFRVVCSSAWTL